MLEMIYRYPRSSTSFDKKKNSHDPTTLLGSDVVGIDLSKFQSYGLLP